MKNQENQSNANLAKIQQMVVANAVRHQENRQAIAHSLYAPPATTSSRWIPSN
jgi:hypothetical protein